MRAVPRLCEFYPCICLTTEEKARKTLSQGKKNLSQVKKNLSQSAVYILPNTHNITKTPPNTTLYKGVRVKVKSVAVGRDATLRLETLDAPGVQRSTLVFFF